MRKLTEYPTLSLKERDRRWALVRAEMAARGLDCLVLCGWPAMWDFNIANARYLCPIGGNAENNVLVFPLSRRADQLHLFAGVHRLLEGRAETGSPTCGRARARFADSIADRLTELKLTGAKIGIDGLAGPLDPDGWTPHSIYTRLHGSAAGREARQSRRHDGEAPRREERRGDRGARQGGEARRPDARAPAATPRGPASRNARSMPA